MSNPVADTVSIVSANYNNGPFLDDFFESVVNSSMRPLELIIVDDGSLDNSKIIISKWAALYDWIKPIYLSQNEGVANATNKAISIAAGKFILRIDSDDLLLPKRIENQLKFFEEYPETDVLGGNCIYFDSDTGKELRRSQFPASQNEIEKLFHQGENGVLNGTTMVKKEYFLKFPYRQEMVWAEDYDCFARMLKGGAVFNAQHEALTKVRIHRRSATSNLAWDTIEKAWKLSVELFNNRTSRSAVRRNYFHLQNYRRYLLSSNPFMRLYFLSISALLRPDKVLKSLRNK